MIPWDPSLNPMKDQVKLTRMLKFTESVSKTKQDKTESKKTIGFLLGRGQEDDLASFLCRPKTDPV